MRASSRHTAREQPYASPISRLTRASRSGAVTFGNRGSMVIQGSPMADDGRHLHRQQFQRDIRHTIVERAYIEDAADVLAAQTSRGGA
jgi:hypothetical protein